MNAHRYQVLKLGAGYSEIHTYILDDLRGFAIPGTLTLDPNGVLKSYSPVLESVKDKMVAEVLELGIDNIDEMVEVTNLMSGKTVLIRKDEKGGPCDPSTERYWSM